MQCADAHIAYKSIPRYPAIGRDIALVLQRDIPAAKLQQKAREIGGELLRTVRVFDVYTGENIGLDKKSIALSLVFRHDERTLTDEEVNEVHERIVRELEQEFAAELRK